MEKAAGEKNQSSLFLALFLTSWCVLTLEITYARIFSVLTYYHFSSMIISIALLGFGAGAAYLTVKSRKVRTGAESLGPYLLLFFVSIVLSFFLIIKINFYPLEWQTDWTNQLSLVFFYGAMGLPFFFAGLVISSLFSFHPERANTLYFFDLLGAGLGSLGTVLLFNVFSAPFILHLLAVVGLFFLVLSPLSKPVIRLTSLAFLALFGFFAYKVQATGAILVYPPPSKSMFNYAQPWKGRGSIEYSKWNIIERVDVTRSLKQKVWGFGGEVSPVFKDRECELRYIFKDGIMSSGIMKIDKKLEDYDFLSGYLMSAPYYLNDYRSAIIIGPGGGIDILIALYHRLHDVIGVELNPEKVRLLEGRYSAYSGRLNEKCTLVPWEGRHYFSRFKGKVDVIATSGLDEYPALSSGSYAMSENYIFTVESTAAMLDHLTERGVLSFTRIYFDPPRETFKLVVTMKEALRRMGVAEPSRHFLIVKGKKWANVILKKTPFEPEEVKKLEAWAAQMKFGYMYLPYEKQANYVDQYLRLPATGEKKFIREYPYKISAATDNSPFFFQYYKWKNLFRAKTENWAYYQLAPLGLKMAFFSLVQVVLFGLAFIAGPLLSLRLPRKSGWLLPMVYFSAIGLGYILIEIVLIQKLNFFLGGAVYALAVTLFVLLSFSGVGSYYARRLEISRRFFIKILAGVAGLSLVYLIGLDFILKLLMPLGRVQRIASATALLAPLGILMGIPFPSGIKHLKKKNMEAIIPWSWGVNSIFTVFGSVLCLIVSLNWGFSAAFLLGILSYGTALLSAISFETKA